MKNSYLIAIAALFLSLSVYSTDCNREQFSYRVGDSVIYMMTAISGKEASIIGIPNERDQVVIRVQESGQVKTIRKEHIAVTQGCSSDNDNLCVGESAVTTNFPYMTGMIVGILPSGEIALQRDQNGQIVQYQVSSLTAISGGKSEESCN